MSRRTGFSVSVQVLLWAVGNSLAGAAIGLAVGMFQQGGFDPRIVTVSVLFGNVVGFTVLASSMVLFPRARDLGPVARAAVLGVTLVSGAAVGTALVLFLFPLYVLRDLPQALAVAFVNAALALVVGGVVYAYEGLRWRLAESLREVEEVRLVEAKLREEAARAQLAALQARINPHFFFNTLNTISSLLAEDPQGAEDLVQRLADLFRYTFRVSGSGPVPLADELGFITGYLEIEKARFGSRLQVLWNVSPEARSFPVPGLILQPLVENAVGHGIAPVPAGGTVRIAALAEAGELVVEVRDDGAGLAGPAETLVREGHGLGNVRRRLAAAFGEGASLEILPGPGGRGAVARVRLSRPPRSAS